MVELQWFYLLLEDIIDWLLTGGVELFHLLVAIFFPLLIVGVVVAVFRSLRF